MFAKIALSRDRFPYFQCQIPCSDTKEYEVVSLVFRRISIARSLEEGLQRETPCNFP